MADTTEDGLKILVVDDERDIREGVERILKRMGYQVFTAGRGEEALAVLENQSVALAILDLKMPGMDGMELHQRIRAIDDQIIVIIITGYATIETAIEAMKQGAYDFIPKPFEPEHLRIVVRRAHEKLRLKQESERLQMERARTLMDLDTEKSRIRTIVEALPTAVVVTNTAGEVVLMNPAFMNSLDLDASTMVPGQNLCVYVPDPGFCEMVSNLSSGEACRIGDAPTYELTVSGSKYLMARGQSVINENNDCMGAVVTLSNITSLKMLDQLKSEFVAKVSHELRSPLSTIHEQLAMVLKETSGHDSDVDQHLIERAKEKTHGLISLIGDLLDLSRIEAGGISHNVQPIQVTDLLSSIVDFLGIRATAKGQSLTFEPADEALPLISADPMALESIFGNLIANAINYSPQGGKIVVKAGKADAGHISVQVADTGFGIAPKYHEQIFERFYRVKDDNTRYITGTGLGLPIVKGLVDAMNGAITLDSDVGKGTTFTVTLPV
ncbi:MAG: response regulator [Desulfobacteraceae bacterium]|nr:MAG: response regulator [Desulfobacteraceae bacterium]